MGRMKVRDSSSPPSFMGEYARRAGGGRTALAGRNSAASVEPLIILIVAPALICALVFARRYDHKMTRDVVAGKLHLRHSRLGEGD
jgi:hypothetical protein